ncbi:MAG: fibronectin type III domain-containing protein [Thermoleophilaceae bacterium]|nr:fibronectin type III domain-containing protein [Thermoleophilaceae bacterium]
MRKLVTIPMLVAVAAVAPGCATGLVTKLPSAVTETSATVNGAIWTTDGGQVSYWVEYGTTTAYERETARRAATVAEDTPHDVSIPLDDLTPSTTWHYRICAEDAQAGTCSRDATVFTGDSVTGTAANCRSLEVDLSTCPPDLPLSYLVLTAGATSGPSGQDPAGSMTWVERFIGGGVLGETQVTCLAVTGNVGVVGVAGTWTIVGSFGRIPLRAAGLIRVTDGGGPASGLDTYELHVVHDPFPPQPPGPPLPGPTDCSSFPAGAEVRRNLGGDLVVTDVDPVPAPTAR